MKLLLIGPRLNQDNLSVVGGAITLFENLIYQLDSHNISYSVIDTNKHNYPNRWHAYFSIFLQIILKQKSSTHLSLHSSRDYLIFGPLLILIGKIFSKHVSLRKFGGEASRIYQESHYFKKKFIHMIYKHVDTLFFELHSLVNFFQPLNPYIFWFPNVREQTITPLLPRSYHKKFVFISSVKHQKGINEIIQASKLLPDTYSIDIYGPIDDNNYSKEYFRQEQISYKDILSPQEVLATLNTYDVLLLPTYYKGEGYPGIIIEAYSLGIPVISTNLQGIMEIVDHTQTGFLIEPKSVDQLLEKIYAFTSQNYPIMSQYAYRKFNDFNAETQTKQFLIHIDYA